MGTLLWVCGFGVFGDLIIIYPKPYSVYLRGTILILKPRYSRYGLGLRIEGFGFRGLEF